MNIQLIIVIFLSVWTVHSNAMMTDKQLTRDQKKQLISKLCNTPQAWEELDKINQWPPKIDELTGQNFHTVLKKVKWYYFLHTRTEKHERQKCNCTELRTRIDKQLYTLFVVYTSQQKKIDPAIENFLKWAEQNNWYDLPASRGSINKKIDA